MPARAVWLPWLLLLVPTVVIGVAALLTLRREQQRLRTQTAAVAEAAAAATRTRAQVAAENIELFVGEVRDGLLRELDETPAAQLPALLANWPATNPLVGGTLRWSERARDFVWPRGDAPEQLALRARYTGWLRGTEDERERRRDAPAAPLAAASPPPALEPRTFANEPVYGAEEEAAARSNRVQVEQQRNFRQEAQVLARNSAVLAKREAPASAVGGVANSAAGASSSSFKAEKPEAEVTEAANADAAVPTVRRARGLGAEVASIEEKQRAAVGDSAAAAPLVLDAFVQDVPPTEGWLVRDTADGARTFLGWRRLVVEGEIVGVELALAPLLERVAALVPPAAEDGERFALLRAGAAPGPAGREADFRVPLATTLPGWELAAWHGPAAYAGETGAQAFFVVGALLVTIFAAAIGTGGWLFFQQAQVAEREAALKTSFVANVSHEMKTPLTTLRMYAELLAEGRVADEAKRRRYLETIGRETTRLARLVNNVLEFSRLDAGRKEYRRDRVALATALERLGEMQAARAAEAGVALQIEPAPEDAAVQGDGDALEQVLLNLCDNALKYGAAGGAVDVRVEPAHLRQGEGERSAWRVIVADRGPGVPVAQRERIFERFHRVDDSLTARVQGVGLGLTIARRLARDQDGELVCRERAGGGAEFVLTLPAA